MPENLKRIPIKVKVGIALATLLITLGYLLHWNWTGFPSYTLPNTQYQREKTLWDWLQLLFVPLLLGMGGIWFTSRLQRDRELAEKQQEADRNIAINNQRQTALQEYINKMSELLLEKNLLNSEEGSEIRTIARSHTLTVLPDLDPHRKQRVLQFLYESDLIKNNTPIILLNEADLSSADLEGANLSRAFLVRANLFRANLFRAHLDFADLGSTNLERANLFEADLLSTNLSFADLSGADLEGARLDGANLERANLWNTNIKQYQLDTVESLKDAIMPNGERHKED